MKVLSLLWPKTYILLLTTKYTNSTMGSPLGPVMAGIFMVELEESN